MLHDVTVQVHDALNGGMRREIATVDAATGDEAVAAAQLEIVRRVGHGNFRVVGVVPSEARPEPAPEAAVEGAEAAPAPRGRR